MKKIKNIIMLAFLSIPLIASSSFASIANDLAKEQSDGLNKMAPLKLGEGVSIVGASSKGSEVTYNFKLDGEFANASKSDLNSTKELLINSLCSSNMEKIALIQGVTKRYNLKTSSGSAQMQVTISAKSCKIKAGDTIKLTKQDLQDMASGFDQSLPIKFSPEFSIVSVSAENMIFTITFQISEKLNNNEIKIFSELSKKFGCANGNILTMINGGASVIYEYIDANNQSISNTIMTKKFCEK